jgi:hypothetical protein
MSEEEKKDSVEFTIVLPKTSDFDKSRQVVFNKLLSLIEEKKNYWNVRVRSNKKKRGLVLDSNEFELRLSFTKTFGLTVVVGEPDKNRHMSRANKIGKDVINFITTLLGEGAKGCVVRSSKTTIGGKKKIDFGERIIGASRLTKINEKVGLTLTVAGVMFEYELDGKKFWLTGMEEAEMLFSSNHYEGEIPFDLLQVEYGDLKKQAKLIGKLAEMES